jgi:tripartite-type tricarboxylate transporter receptor subunit TctC
MFVRIAVATLSLVLTGALSAQTYPEKPVRIITGTAGGGSDIAARILVQGVPATLGQPLVVDNRTTLLAIDAASKAAPDGYTLLVLGGGIWITPLLQKTTWDGARDFAPISLMAREANLIAVHPSMPIKSVKDLITLAKSRPGELNYGTGATGAPSHLGGELFKSMTGVNLVRVPYKGNTAALVAQLGGEIQLTFGALTEALPHTKAGKLRGLAVTSLEPSALLPGVPTVAATVPGYESIGLIVIMAPAKTPAAIVTRLNQEVVRYIRQANVRDMFLSAGAEVVADTPEQFANFIKADVAKWTRVIKEAGIRIE